MSKFKWPLCADVFTIWDKLKISKFLFTERIWTYGEWVKKYEQMWSDFLGGSHVIMVSSGSTANELIALRRKWELEQAGEWPRRNKVVAPCNTWISSVSPFYNSGYEVVFTDVAPNNLNMTSAHLKEVLAKDVNKEIGTVFYTALLGFFGDLHECKRLTEEHGARFLMDNCEATLSGINGPLPGEKINLLNFATSSTSLFYSHFLVSGTEGGLIVTQDESEADFFRMMRSHGLTRGMPEKYKNPKVSPEFDFALMGSNYRSSNLQAYMASLDFRRAIEYSINNRADILREFYYWLDMNKFEDFTQEEPGFVTPLALPIVCKTEEMKIKVETYCKLMGAQTRPIIGGCLCEHTAFKGKCDSGDYPVALNAHKKGLYVGINKNVTLKMAKKLAQELSKL